MKKFIVIRIILVTLAIVLVGETVLAAKPTPPVSPIVVMQAGGDSPEALMGDTTEVFRFVLPDSGPAPAYIHVSLTMQVLDLTLSSFDEVKVSTYVGNAESDMHTFYADYGMYGVGSFKTLEFDATGVATADGWVYWSIEAFDDGTGYYEEPNVPITVAYTYTVTFPKP